eukprot:7091999-Prymnesium_polylepis.1
MAMCELATRGRGARQFGARCDAQSHVALISLLPVRRMDGAPSGQADTCPLTECMCVCYGSIYRGAWHANRSRVGDTRTTNQCHARSCICNTHPVSAQCVGRPFLTRGRVGALRGRHTATT